MGAMPIPQPTAGKTTVGGAVGTMQPQTVPGGPAQTPGSNPFQPGAAAPGVGVTNTTGGAITPVTNDPNQTNLQKQETDIYGKGVGGEITSLLGSIGGVDSSSLQNYVASLQPQEAAAQTNVSAQLGASGVSGNSSVNAIASSNLQAQETAAIAGESAQLQQSGQNLEASILTGQEQSAAQEVSASGWSVFGDVLGAIGTDTAQAAGAIAKVGGFNNPTSTTAGTSSGF